MSASRCLTWQLLKEKSNTTLSSVEGGFHFDQNRGPKSPIPEQVKLVTDSLQKKVCFITTRSSPFTISMTHRDSSVVHPLFHIYYFIIQSNIISHR